MNLSYWRPFDLTNKQKPAILLHLQHTFHLPTQPANLAKLDLEKPNFVLVMILIPGKNNITNKLYSHNPLQNFLYRRHCDTGGLRDIQSIPTLVLGEVVATHRVGLMILKALALFLICH